MKRSKRLSIAARDGWKCWICGRALKDYPRIKPPLPDDYPTVDHVVPQACGGTDANDNLRLACPPCNVRRGAPGLPDKPVKPARTPKWMKWLRRPRVSP